MTTTINRTNPDGGDAQRDPAEPVPEQPKGVLLREKPLMVGYETPEGRVAVHMDTERGTEVIGTLPPHPFLAKGHVDGMIDELVRKWELKR